jgi:hypothetical protein
MGSDREDIIDLMTRYAWNTDTKNYGMMDQASALNPAARAI